jgi:hypothetical protein
MSRAKSAKHALSEVEGDAKVTALRPASRATARDLRKISPVDRNDKPNPTFATLAYPSIRLRTGLARGNS